MGLRVQHSQACIITGATRQAAELSKGRGDTEPEPWCRSLRPPHSRWRRDKTLSLLVTNNPSPRHVIAHQEPTPRRTQPRLRGTTPSQARPTCPPLRCRRPSLSLPRAAASGRAVHAPTARRVWPHHTEPSKTGDAFPFQAGELPPPAMVYNGDTTAPHTACARAHHKLSQTQHTITLTHSHTHTHTPRHR